MIFNFYRPYPLLRPKKDGWYTCTVEYGQGEFRVMDLYYTVWNDTFRDRRRETVFEGYKVYGACRATIEENRVHTDSLCGWSTSVIAWKRLPKTYGWWRRKD